MNVYFEAYFEPYVNGKIAAVEAANQGARVGEDAYDVGIGACRFFLVEISEASEGLQTQIEKDCRHKSRRRYTYLISGRMYETQKVSGSYMQRDKDNPAIFK